uniref:Uncharacterized protein n=1 Tax=Panagrolaimus sp. ES5 TaxID=591445 RepID=A0AC34GB72_9BILA
MYFLAPRKVCLKDKSVDIEIDDENKIEDIKTALRDIEISCLTLVMDAHKRLVYFEKLTSEYPNYYPIYLAEIERLSKAKKIPELKKMVEKLMEIIESKKVAEFFGVKSEFSEENLRKKEIMENKKSAIIDALFFQANLFLDSLLKVSTKDIPDAFRNNFDPRKENTAETTDKTVEVEKQIVENDDAITESGKNFGQVDFAELDAVEKEEEETSKMLKENKSTLVAAMAGDHFNELSEKKTSTVEENYTTINEYLSLLSSDDESSLLE